MELSFTTQGFLIYTAMFVYFMAFLVALSWAQKVSRFIFALGFILAVLSYTYRGLMVGYVPLQNLFEIFLFLGVIVYPAGLVGQKYLDVPVDWFDMLAGVVVLFPAGFVFDMSVQTLPPILQSPFFVPHVAVYMIAYLVMAKAGVKSMSYLIRPGGNQYDKINSADSLIRVGFVFLTFGLILGSVWGKYAWGDYWNWDPKELWSLVTWLVYAGYFHFQVVSEDRYPRINCIWSLAGFGLIVVTLLWVNLAPIFNGLHSYA